MKTAGSPAPASLLLLLSLACLSATELREEVPDWPPSRSTSATVGDLHREYHNIFRHGNRNAASHLWATFLLERAHQMTWERLEYFFSGFCAVSGSPVRPGDYQRYELQLPSVTGGALRGFMYYCCWPCVCDTNDWIKVDTLSVRTADASTPRSVHVAVIGNPCARAAALKEPFIDAFGRGETTLELQAPEVRCSADGVLEGATLSDHGHVVIQIFPLIGDGHASDSPDPLRSLPDGESPTPGRMRRDPVSGLHYQQCARPPATHHYGHAS